jgi:hypothetical protein
VRETVSTSPVIASIVVVASEDHQSLYRLIWIATHTCAFPPLTRLLRTCVRAPTIVISRVVAHKRLYGDSSGPERPLMGIRSSKRTRCAIDLYHYQNPGIHRSTVSVAQQQTFASDPKYKKYSQQVEKCLNSFDNVHEWADCIAFLKQLLKVCTRPTHATSVC